VVRTSDCPDTTLHGPVRYSHLPPFTASPKKYNDISQLAQLSWCSPPLARRSPSPVRKRLATGGTWRGGALPCKATLAFSGAGVPRRARPHLPSLARGRLAVQGHTCLIDVAASNAGIACRGTTVPLTGGPHRRSTGAAQPCAHCHPPSPPRPSAGSRCAMLRLPVC
jgi:hypothetical protein